MQNALITWTYFYFIDQLFLDGLGGRGLFGGCLKSMRVF